MAGTGRKPGSFSVTSEQRGHTAHLRLIGEIDMASAPALERCLHAAESNGNTAIVLDLERVTFIDSSGVRTFLGAAHRATGSGRAFVLIRVPALVQRVLRITGTTHLLAADALALSGESHPLGEPSFAMQTKTGGVPDVSGSYNTQGIAQAAG